MNEVDTRIFLIMLTMSIFWPIILISRKARKCTHHIAYLIAALGFLWIPYSNAKISPDTSIRFDLLLLTPFTILAFSIGTIRYITKNKIDIEEGKTQPEP